MSKLYLLRRIVEISFFLVLYSLGSIYRWVVQVLSGRGPAIGPPIGEPLAALCESLGPTFIKIGQILSSRPDLLPPEVTIPLSRLQDRVALVGAGKIERQIEKSFGRPIAEIFEFFDPVPVSGASVAQVHRARLRTGEEVAVKIRRPHVIATVKRDLLVLDFFIRVAELIPAMRLIPVRELFGEFGRLIEQQLDFDFETNNNRRFRQNFADWKQVVIPRLIDEFCTESILTMEYLDGLMKVTALTFSPEQCQEAAVFSLHALYKMIFEDGFVHGDMHPGNIFFRQGGEFVLLDLGLVAILEPREVAEFARFFFGMVSNNGKE